MSAGAHDDVGGGSYSPYVMGWVVSGHTYMYIRSNLAAMMQGEILDSGLPDTGSHHVWHGQVISFPRDWRLLAACTASSML